MKSCHQMFIVLILRMGLGALAMFVAPATPLMRAAEMKPEDVVARHLDAIGTAATRAACKSRIVQGTAAR